ncbi:MAG: 50S ribosomal protein L18a [Desulfurococcaceae archaeon]|jgi:large subunit ribosomal protein LX|nr:50S ribosomal protein L18a [Desulfurococcaceae archaeon]
MSREVKVYRITGFMLIGQDKYPQWAKFVKEIRALKPEHAIERLYSELGSKHKVKRANIKIVDIVEIKPEEAEDRLARDLERLTSMVLE